MSSSMMTSETQGEAMGPLRTAGLTLENRKEPQRGQTRYNVLSTRIRSTSGLGLLGT